MPKKFLQFLDLVYDHLFYIKDNIVVLYFSDLVKQGYSEDELRLIIENLINKKIIASCNIRYALKMLPIPTQYEKKKELLRGAGWAAFGDNITKKQYVIELTSRESFFDLYKTIGGKTNSILRHEKNTSEVNLDFRGNSELATLHHKILEKCSSLYVKGEYSEAVEKGFKVVRDRLRELTGFEKGSEAFGKGKLFIGGAPAKNVEADFNEGVKFLTMAIDMFRNEKSHTADAKIDDAVRAYEYLRLSSLAMNLLDQAEKRYY